MGHSKFFWKSVLFGAIAGGALSLLNRETRHAVMNDCKKTANNISYIVKNSNEVVDQLKEVSSKVRATVEEISEDVSCITGKVSELRDTTPQVTEIMKDTREAFKKNGQA